MIKRSRGIQVKFRLSEEEAEQLKAKIKSSGMSQQEYLLKCALNKKVTNTDGMKEISFQLKKVGVNLNQIAESLNSKGYYDYRLITKNQEELNEIWQLLKQYLQRQG